MDRAYILNLETGKIELQFTKEEYIAMPDDQKKLLKRIFRFNKYPAPKWASKAKEPNLYTAIRTAKELGFTVEERRGERISFAEQIKRKSERAEAKAERYDEYADNAVLRAESLQSDFNSHRGDISFITQPNIPTASGRSFTNYRDRIMARYNKGFDEYRKSEYFRERASTSRDTASMSQYQNVAYLDRRISEQRSILNRLTKGMSKYEEILLRRENGDRSDHLAYSDEAIQKWLTKQLERIEVETDKLAFYMNCLDEAGGLQFSRDNIKRGFIVMIRGSKAEVLTTNPKKVVVRYLEINSILDYPYAEIQEVIEAIEKPRDKDSEQHPFVTGDIIVSHNIAGSCIIRAYQVMKTSAKMIEIQELLLQDGNPQAGVFSGEPSKKIKPFVNFRNKEWQVRDSNGWIFTKFQKKAVDNT